LENNRTDNYTLEFHFHEIHIFPFPEIQFREWILFLINNEHNVSGDINIIFCSDQYLYEMNVSYLNHDYFTDVITFDYGKQEKNFVSGDVFISIDRITENAKMNGFPFLTELARIVFHGILHLIGYSDNSKDEKDMMTSKENFYLRKCNL